MMNPRVLEVKPLDSFSLRLVFENGEKKQFDVSPYLNKGIFKSLNDKEIFNSVKVVDGAVQWSNEADLCPDTLYLNSVTIA